MPIQKSGEDYLEAILVLKQKNGTVRSIDVAHHLDYSKPSVSRAVGNLRQDGLLEVGDGGELLLTDKGLAIAQAIYERHTILTALFVSLGVPKQVAAEDACLVEHVISDVTFEQIKQLYYQRALDKDLEGEEPPPKPKKEGKPPKEEDPKKKRKKNKK